MRDLDGLFCHVAALTSKRCVYRSQASAKSPCDQRAQRVPEVVDSNGRGIVRQEQRRPSSGEPTAGFARFDLGAKDETETDLDSAVDPGSIGMTQRRDLT